MRKVFHTKAAKKVLPETAEKSDPSNTLEFPEEQHSEEQMGVNEYQGNFV